MSRKTALLLTAFIVAALSADAILNGSAGLMFLGRRLIQLTEYIAFWR